MSAWISQLGVAFMWALARLPLPVVRALGWALGWMLFLIVPSRRKVAALNYALAIKKLSNSEQKTMKTSWDIADIFQKFAQAWLDRSWLWHCGPQTLNQRLQITGDARAIAMLADPAQALVIFAPHFVGLDAGWTALTSRYPQRRWATIYSDQSNKVVDAWILQGRERYAKGSLLGRASGVKPIAAALKAGGALYLLPDMDFGPDGAEFVPFFGEQAATVTSLSRFAKLGKAPVISVMSRITARGYEIEVSAPWASFPTPDLKADTARMNAELEAMIARNPQQYWWLHKRYKTRPPGQAALY